MPLRLPPSPAQPLLRKMIAAGLQAADAYHALLNAVSLSGHVLRVGSKSYDLTRYHRVIAIGAGKASARMAQALEHALGARLEGGLVVVKTGHRLPTRRIQIVEAGHPTPDRAGLQATRRLRAMLAGVSSRDLVIVLLSGGASSLLPAPVAGVSLTDKQRTTQLLLKCGATIQEMNIVRKHLSLLKGGQMAASTKGSMVTLVLSDVIGDDLASIGSGPTVADPTTFDEAVGVLQQYNIWRLAPPSVRRHLMQGRRGAAPETLKPGARRFRQVHHEIIGNNGVMLNAVTRAARQAGYRTVLFSTALTGNAQEAARRWAGLAQRISTGTGVLRRPCCVVAGGETTVTVTGRGKGGRAQEFTAAAALGIAGLPNVWVAALGSDGTDGPTDVAGAVVDGDTATRAQKTGVDLHRAVQRHDTYRALNALQCHIRTGPTGTNVNDLYLLLLL